MPGIEFVNHASYIVTHNNLRLIVDPWIEGTAFNEGWSLIEPTKLKYSDFSEITHIWFSHEHPDHFSPGNLKSIPEEIRKRITVLFQETPDKKVVGFCKNLNFKACIELRPHWFELAPDFKILNVPHTDGDSWMCINAGGKYILNVNDCVLEDNQQALAVKSKIDSDAIDVLFTQFSYANWAGNKEDKEVRKKFAEKKLKEIQRQVSIFRPVYTIPFASFVWFCHAENFYMNDEVNKIDFVYRYIRENLDTSPVVLFPGDQWNMEVEHDSMASTAKWMDSYDRNILIEKIIVPVSVKEDELIESGNNFIRDLKKNNTVLMRFFLKPCNIFIEDHRRSYALSLNGFEPNEIKQEHCDISMGSDSMKYCFKFLWGGATTRINGRFQVPGGGRFYNWKLYFQTSELNNHGERFDLKFVLTSLYRRLRKKVAV